MSNTLNISRQKNGRSFIYKQANDVIENEEFIDWANSLAVPPAWKDVKISRSKRAKVLAVGYDSAGRQQAIYSPSFRVKQEKLKFDRILRFAQALPKLRRQLDKDLALKRLNKSKVLACVVKLIDEAYFRVGNEQYARQNNSYGITTMRKKHLDISGNTVTFDFVGKSGQQHVKQITDSQIARIIKQLEDLPGYEVFSYKGEDGSVYDIDTKDVNEYIKQHMGEEFSAKDFRTWGGTLLAATELLACEYYDNEKERQTTVTRIVKNVAKRLGNTPAIARSSYIDPRVITAYVNTSELRKIKQAMLNMRPKKYMTRDEQCVMRILKTST
jgi:DNA topoisomerase-1